MSLLNGVPGKVSSEQEKTPRYAAGSWSSAIQSHWLLYIFEGAELALFMISACVFSVILFDPSLPVQNVLPDPVLRRLLMGISMGGTAVLIIRSSMGKRSGAHFNPAITLTYLRLGKIARPDACFYVLSHFIGGVAGVGVSALLLGRALVGPHVMYAETVPGKYGTAAAFAAETFMAALLMGVVLWISNQPALASRTSYCVGVLITFYVLIFAPVSGFSINPARTTGSAVFAQVWTGLWVYFTAPVLGMLFSAEVYVRSRGRDRILCAKLHPDNDDECPFLCNYPGHHHRQRPATIPKQLS